MKTQSVRLLSAPEQENSPATNEALFMVSDRLSTSTVAPENKQDKIQLCLTSDKTNKFGSNSNLLCCQNCENFTKSIIMVQKPIQKIFKGLVRYTVGYFPGFSVDY